MDVAEREGMECVRRALELLSNNVICGTEPVSGADDDGEDSFVDVVTDQRDEGAESEGFIFDDALMRANLLSEMVLEGDVGSFELPCVSLHSSLSLVFSIGVI